MSVTQSFWQALQDGEYAKARSLATKESRETFDRLYTGATTRPAKFDSSDEDELSAGDATVDGDRAVCPTTVDNVQFMTYLLREDGAWRVDLTRTGEEIFSDAAGAIEFAGRAAGQALAKVFEWPFGRTDRQAPSRGRPAARAGALVFLVSLLVTVILLVTTGAFFLYHRPRRLRAEGSEPHRVAT